MKKQKDDEMAVIILKFKNRKMDLESQQKQEKTLTENENLFKQSKTLFFIPTFSFFKNIFYFFLESAALRFSTTQKNFNKVNSPPKFKLYPPELRLRELSKSIKKNQDGNTVKFVSNINPPHLNSNQNQGNDIKYRGYDEISEKDNQGDSIDITKGNFNQAMQNHNENLNQDSNEIDHNEQGDEQGDENDNKDSYVHQGNEEENHHEDESHHHNEDVDKHNQVEAELSQHDEDQHKMEGEARNDNEEHHENEGSHVDNQNAEVSVEHSSDHHEDEK
jgi:hypothetical protein